MSFNPGNISPTAHYTAYVWYKNNLSLSEFATIPGHILYSIVNPVDKLLAFFLNELSIENFLIQRHKIIDKVLQSYIEDKGYSQIVEIASGLSPRAYHFAKKYPGINFIEVDLEEMISIKKKIIEKNKLELPNLSFFSANVLDNLQCENLQSFLLQKFSKDKKTLFITEGLVNYFSLQDLMQMWKNFLKIFAIFPKAVYLGDIHTKQDNSIHPFSNLGKHILGLFVKSKIHFHFNNDEDVKEALLKSGFTYSVLHDPAKFKLLNNLPVSSRGSMVKVFEGHYEKANSSI